jgi:hypothetical protein
MPNRRQIPSYRQMHKCPVFDSSTQNCIISLYDPKAQEIKSTKASSKKFQKMSAAVCLSICRSSHFLKILAQHLTQTPIYPGPTEPIGQNMPWQPPSIPFRLAISKFSDFEYMTGSRTYASNGLYENVGKSAISTPKSERRGVSHRQAEFFLAQFGIASLLPALLQPETVSSTVVAC